MLEDFYAAMLDAYVHPLPAAEAFERFRRYFEIHNFPWGTLRTKIVSTAKVLAAEFAMEGAPSELVHSVEAMLRGHPMAVA